MISVVVPIYNEERIIVSFHHAIEAVLENTGEDWEVVYVNDGGKDSSLALMLGLQKLDPRIRVVEFSRNFGHQAALTAGLEHAEGDAVILMDGDFQDPPEVLPDLIAAWKTGAKVVIAKRTRRAEKGLRGRLFPMFYKLLGFVSDFPIPLDAGIFGLLDRQAADAIRDLGERNRYLPGLRAWVGFPTAVVFYERGARLDNEPKQTFIRLFKYAMDAIFSFSFKPLRLGMALGGLIFAASLLLAATLFLTGVFGGPVKGIAAPVLTICIVLFTGGVQLVCMGLVGEYIGRIYDEVRRRPLYVVHKVHEIAAPAAIRRREPAVAAAAALSHRAPAA